MINLLSIAKTLLGVVSWIAKYAHDKQLLDAGEYKAIARANEEAFNNLTIAINARRSNGVPEHKDPNNRDNQA